MSLGQRDLPRGLASPDCREPRPHHSATGRCRVSQVLAALLGARARSHRARSPQDRTFSRCSVAQPQLHPTRRLHDGEGVERIARNRDIPESGATEGIPLCKLISLCLISPSILALLFPRLVWPRFSVRFIAYGTVYGLHIQFRHSKHESVHTLQLSSITLDRGLYTQVCIVCTM